MSRRNLTLGWIAIFVMAILGLARLRFDVEVLNLLPAELPAVEGLKLYQRHFANSGELILTVESPDASLSESAARDLTLALRKQTNLVARALWQSPAQEHPEQMAELLATVWLNRPSEEFGALVAKLAPGKIDEQLETSKAALTTTLSPEDIARLGYDPLGLSRVPGASLQGSMVSSMDPFHSADGRFRLIFIRPATPLKSYPTTVAWFESIKRSVTELRSAQQLPESVVTAFTGEPVFVSEISSGMEHDVRNSVSSTVAIIAGLFWLAHRRWKPLGWLVVMLGIMILATLSLGGLLFGTLNIVSLGFAAILLGLGVDYGIVLYQEALDKPNHSVNEVRREMAPGIWWSALTTAGAFVLLNFAGLPGLAQLGTLVGVGVMIAAAIMIYGFLPIAAGKRPKTQTPVQESSPSRISNGSARRTRIAAIGTICLTLFSAIIVARRFPPLDHTEGALSPKDSPAYIAALRIKTQLTHTQEPLWVVISGTNETEVAHHLAAVEKLFSDTPWFTNALLPTALWPNPAVQKENLRSARLLIDSRPAMLGATRKAGFTDEAFGLADQVLTTWQNAASQSGTFWPTNDANRWLVEKFSARTATGWLAAGMVQPTSDVSTAVAGGGSSLQQALARESAWLTGWSVLGPALLVHAETRAEWLLGVMFAFLLLCLWLAFRTLREMLLSLAVLALSFLALLATMSILGWSWNLMNLIAAPLLLGAGVDYTIHTQLALRRHLGDAIAVRATMGRALILCAGTTIAGFGSLAWSGNEGLSSLGRICAAGITIVFIISIGLLPAWWRWANPNGGTSSPTKTQPSSLYSAKLWQTGLHLVRLLPRPVTNALAKTLARSYWLLAFHRREIVVTNLLPVLGGDRDAAKAKAATLIAEFAVKLVDLWRYEGGAVTGGRKTDWNGWPIFLSAQSRGKGVLIVTPHLGNWEIGAAFFVEHGIPLLVLTQAEPQAKLTNLRQEARAQHGIETFVVGTDPFAFVEVIKRLQAGTTVALLVDRPPPSSAVTVRFFGRSFSASNAAAELARASGCAIVPAFVVREESGYTANILPEITYDRAMIGDRSDRTALTERILQSFEPAIQKYADQWYQFVPVWEKSEERRPPENKL